MHVLLLLLKLSGMSMGKCVSGQYMQPPLPPRTHTKPNFLQSQNNTWFKIENTRSGLAKVQRSGQERQEPSLQRTNKQAECLPGTGCAAAFPIILDSGQGIHSSQHALFPGTQSRKSNRMYLGKSNKTIHQITFLQIERSASLD